MIRLSLDAATRSDDPFPHLIADGAYSHFDRLADALPPPDRFTVRGDGRKLELDLIETVEPFARIAGSRRKRLLELREAIRAAAPQLVERFTPHVDDKYRWLLGPLAEEATAGGWTTTNGRSMGRSGGYALAPHLDSAHFGITCLLYFNDAESVADGALCLYKPERPPAVLDASTYYPLTAEGISSEVATVISVKPNRFVAFVCSPLALHGFHRVPASEGWRFVYQCHVVPQALNMDALIPKLDAEHQARWHRLAAR